MKIVSLRNVLFASFLLAFGASNLFAEATKNIEIKVQLESPDEPTKAIGLLLSTSGTEQVPSTSISKLGDKLWDVSFVADSSVIHSDTVATAIGFSGDGKAIFGNVTPALVSERFAALAAIGECPADDLSAITNQNQLGPLRSLVEVRTARSDLAQIKVTKALDTDLLERMKKFEAVFGLSKHSALDADLPPQELVDRLARLNFAIKEYKANRQANKK